MNEIERLAELSVGRACGFAGLAIFTVMVGLSFDPLLSARTGAILLSLAVVVLRYRAWSVRRADYRRTEVWLLLEDKKPHPAASAVILRALRDVYVRFADWAAGTAVVLWLAVGAMTLLE